MAVSLAGSSARAGLDILAPPGKFIGIGSRILASARQPYDLENEPNGGYRSFFGSLALAMLILAMARPGYPMLNNLRKEGVSTLCFCLDVSGSMTAQDFSPNRMEASKRWPLILYKKEADGQDRRGNFFSGESFTLCLLTIDHNVVIAAIQNIRSGLLEDGTAIGSGLPPVLTGSEAARPNQKWCSC